MSKWIGRVIEIDGKKCKNVNWDFIKYEDGESIQIQINRDMKFKENSEHTITIGITDDCMIGFEVIWIAPDIFETTKKLSYEGLCKLV